ncbi:MAG TPA: glycoside hydrolase family 2 TIM barrel-domain containing protein, partial [Ilumatobacteraceae bacterium]|nr:glycoside hydrolase family 2 TIM barrel-domain containing protein [Ilumatobacteraceae bacterium]
TLTKAWLRRRTVLHVAGAESVHAVFVNGGFVGYGTDSRLPSEYDISDKARAGANDVAIVVIRYSAHSYIEDQDQWWMAGLHRSVWVESRPSVHIADLPTTVDFDPSSGFGTVECTTIVDFTGEPEDGWTVRSTLIGPNGKRVGRAQQSTVPSRFAEPYVFRGHQVTARWDVARAVPWSAEEPRTYTVWVELCDPSGAVHQIESQRVGLKRVEVRDRQLLVNGRPIWIFGVNRHDHHPDRGKAVTVDDMRADLTAMRAHNITAVRTSHYPNDSAFLDLCDELGFYVVAEANIESHGYNFSLCNDVRYRDAWLERGARMVQRDRNHASVTLWSLGNESGYGTNHDALAGWIRSADSTRPLHYEDAIRIEGWVDGGRPATDVVCPMYPEITAIHEYGAAGGGDRPLILCEYSHAMGNSNGSLADYWDAITSTPGLQGGFIWEWKDHGLRQRLPDGTVRLAYGGQFGDMPNDGNFVADGLMSADLVPHPAMGEVAWVHRPVTVSKSRRGLEIENRQSFVGLEWLGAVWELIVNGEVESRGHLDVPAVAPRTVVAIPLPCGYPGEGDARLTIRWEARRDQWWCTAGHVVAWDQVTLRDSHAEPSAEGNPLPVSIRVAPQLNLWRAATDNDGFKLMPELAQRLRVGGQALRRWLSAGLDHRPADELVNHHLTVSDSESGRTYRHRVLVSPELADLPRIGALFTLPARFTRMRWFGRGPHENYPDRNRSAMLGIWESPLDDPPYLVPQEFGLRTDCRWYELIDERSGEVVRIDACRPHALHVSATRYLPNDLFEATTASELRPRDEVVVCIDVAHRGLGTASCGPDVLPQYRIGSGRFEFTYRISHRRDTPHRRA